MNVISFCVYGNKPMYTMGMIENLKQCNQFYPDWKPRVYISPTVDKNIAKEYHKLGAEVLLIQEPDCGFFMLYRYLPLVDNSVQRAIFRDADSRLSKRESEAVKQWVREDTDLHVMRDHPYHSGPAILGGMWGAKTNKLRHFSNIMEKYRNISSWERNVDQYLLDREVFPLFKDSVTIHDEVFERKMFPTKRTDLNFVGCQYDEKNNVLHPEHQQILKNYLKEKYNEIL
ncbi:MAG: hypothetical protein EBU90_11690 [Proteobacteria bacterium]|nr:hypothetical protein [Pseudomonadota bacterium]NBP14788.1 hypothetical protein [bacterium]